MSFDRVSVCVVRIIVQSVNFVSNGLNIGEKNEDERRYGMGINDDVFAKMPEYSVRAGRVKDDF